MNFYLGCVNKHRYTCQCLLKTNKSTLPILSIPMPFFIEYGFYYTNQNRTEILKNRTKTEPNKLFRGSRLFRVTVTALNQANKINIFYSFILSNFNICLPYVAFFLKEKHTQKLKKKNLERVLCSIYEDFDSTYETLLHKAKLPFMEVRRSHSMDIESCILKLYMT